MDENFEIKKRKIMSSPLGLFVLVTETRTRQFKVKQVAVVLGGPSLLGPRRVPREERILAQVKLKLLLKKTLMR